MAKQTDWMKIVTPELKHNMQESGRITYINACALREDAIRLFDAKSYPRSAALAILAEEEFSKAFIMLTCAENGRWDSIIFASLRKHSNKQAMSEAMLDYMAWFVDNYKRVIERNRSSFIPMHPAIHPGSEKMNQFIDKAKNIIAKPARDYLKQDAFYVGINENAQVINTPNTVGQEEAEQCLNTSGKFQVVVEIALGRPDAAEKFAQL